MSHQVLRLGAWIGRWNPLLHALVAAISLDVGTDVAFGNGNVNIATFAITFVVVLAASIVLQRRAATRLLAAQPHYPGAPLDFDGTPLELVSVESTDPDVGEREEFLWARPVGESLFRLRSVPTLASGVSRNDVVRCFESGGDLYVADVVERGGHRTVRVTIATHINPEALLDELPPGLSVLRSSGRRLSIDVHPEDDYHALVESLDRLAAGGDLTWYEGSESTART
jgi:hypothetical protein